MGPAQVPQPERDDRKVGCQRSQNGDHRRSSHKEGRRLSRVRRSPKARSVRQGQARKHLRGMVLARYVW